MLPLRSTFTRSLSTCRSRSYQRYFASAPSRNAVRIVEVAPRDGLQNEPGVIPPEIKVELIQRLQGAGLNVIEAGSFVSPKWVPQMADTPSVIRKLRRQEGTRFPVLVPNLKGLDALLSVLSEGSEAPPPINEISVFTAATDGFNLANTNVTVADSLTRLAPVVEQALRHGFRVRGYVSVAVICPYSGYVEPVKVKQVANALLQMGCYEISLGDTVGMATPFQVSQLVEEVSKDVSVEYLAGHFHNTYGTAIANIFAALSCGIRTFDSSVAGLGGCPYSPGATGNVATEDVVYAIQNSEYQLQGSSSGGIDLDALVDIGWWISEILGRDNASSAGKAIRAKRRRLAGKRS